MFVYMRILQRALNLKHSEPSYSGITDNNLFFSSLVRDENIQRKFMCEILMKVILKICSHISLPLSLLRLTCETICSCHFQKYIQKFPMKISLRRKTTTTTMLKKFIQDLMYFWSALSVPHIYCTHIIYEYMRTSIVSKIMLKLHRINLREWMKQDGSSNKA